MLDLLLNYFKNNEDFNQINKSLDKDIEEYKSKISYIRNLYYYANNLLIFHDFPAKSLKPNLIRYPDQDIARFQFYLLNRFGITKINKYENQNYYLKKKKFKQDKKLKELFFKNIQHYFKNNSNQIKNFENQIIFGVKYYIK